MDKIFFICDFNSLRMELGCHTDIDVNNKRIHENMLTENDDLVIFAEYNVAVFPNNVKVGKQEQGVICWL